MAEAPNATIDAAAPAASTDAAQAPLTSMADLDARMAEIRANPPPADTPPVQGDTPTAGQDQPDPSRPAEPAQGDVPDADDGATEQIKPGGRFARLKEQLTAAEQETNNVRQQLVQRDSLLGEGLRQFVDLVLPDATYRQLEVAARNGDWEAKGKLDVADTWRRMVAPVWDTAQRAVKQQFDADLKDLRTLDGMDGETHRRLLEAGTPGEKIKAAWTLARKAAAAEHKERIEALEAEVATLKTNKAANGSQPAAGGGRAVNGSAALAGWLGSDGLPTEEAIARARMGGFRDLATP